MRGFALHPETFGDLDQIREHIAEDSPEAADRVITEIFDGIGALVPFPNQGYQRPNLTRRHLRFKLMRDYVIAYAPEKKPLWVVAVFHGRRSLRVMAAILKGREARS
jgi:plasmid stabilization system protein ParE